MTILADGICNADDLCIRVTVRNAAPDEQTIELLPTLGFRNTWSWGLDDRRPSLSVAGGALVAQHHSLGRFVLAEKFQTDPGWQGLIPFREYFHGDSGAGVGASHQTG